uniref:Uncharacterized protein n=1 Tax=Hyaloperonospora arabidopsidis (strain Emoy2) TaxID=559515 RepID=M4B6Q4_HYAAE
MCVAQLSFVRTCCTQLHIEKTSKEECIGCKQHGIHTTGLSKMEYKQTIYADVASMQVKRIVQQLLS